MVTGFFTGFCYCNNVTGLVFTGFFYGNISSNVLQENAREYLCLFRTLPVRTPWLFICNILHVEKMNIINLSKYTSRYRLGGIKMRGGGAPPMDDKAKRPKSAFKMLFWTDQMVKMEKYLVSGQYPFVNMEKEKKRDFRRIAQQYKMMNGHLNKLIVFRRMGNGGSVSKYTFIFPGFLKVLQYCNNTLTIL